ncbi:hypothetical protein, partial [uncultured Gimesia sp.]|uniref:hypothetical protein n=1 Tax=uncultured Gimesia sp. TaxID=1678688 RepID=UPI0030D7096C
DLLLAALGPDFIRAHPLFFRGVRGGKFVIECFTSFPCSVKQSNLARRVDTWVDPYTEGAGMASLV